MELIVEKLAPVLLAVISGLATAFLVPGQMLLEMRTQLLGDMINFAAILVGFLATAEAILASVMDKKVIAELKRLERYQPLIDYFSEGIFVAFVMVLFSGAIKLVKLDPTALSTKIIIPAWTGLVVWSISAAYRVVRLFTIVLRNL